MAERVSLADALTREHHEIDAGIEEFAQGLENGEPLGVLAAPLRSAMTALRRHIYLEEEFAFPPVREGGLTMPIMVMEREHGVLWGQMDDLEDSLDRFGEAASSEESAALIAACQEMLTLLESHNSKEEPIIYPHLDVKLSEEQAAELRRLIDSGTLPEGWVCEKAGQV